MRQMRTTMCPQYTRNLIVLLQHTFEINEEEFEIKYYDVPHDTFIMIEYDEENPIWSFIIFKYGSVKNVLEEILDKMRSPMCTY